MKRVLSFVSGVLAATLLVAAQDIVTNAPLQFDTDEWDFGKIEEKDGVVSHVFNFANTSKSNVTIDDVVTSCGCTTASYPTKAIAPGEMSQITVNFNPARTEGKVFREIEIFTKGRRTVNRLLLTADVIPTPLDVKQLYPYMMIGTVRAITTRCNFGYIAQGTAESKSLTIINDGDKDVNLDIEGLRNDGILSAEFPPVLRANQADGINLTYSIAIGKDNYGNLRDTLWLIVDGKKSERPFIITAVRTADFSKTNVETAPNIITQPSLVDFGIKSKNRVYKEAITISNNGKSNLHILNIECRNDAAISLTEGTIIKPGQILSVQVSIKNSSEESNQKSGYIYISSDDPDRPLKELRLQISTK